MKQKTTTTPPAWVEEMHKWQKENPTERAVFCIATDNTDNGSSNATLFGSNLQLTSALFVAMIQESGYVNICKGALEAKENPIAAIALISALEKSKKGETSNKEDEEAPTDTSIKGSLKTILSKLADKL